MVKQSTEYLTQCISETILLIERLLQIEDRDERVERIAIKAQLRYQRLLGKLSAIDPTMGSLADSDAIQQSAADLFNRGAHLIQKYADNSSVAPARITDLRAISFAVVCNNQSVDELCASSVLAVTAAFRMGVEEGMKTKLRFQVLPSGNLRSD